MTETFSNKDDNDKKSVVLLNILEKVFGLLVLQQKKIKERWQKKLIKN